jgi:hypothetical protein
MAFGPESTNPRERRAYAHTMISKLASGEVNYGIALQAAWLASQTVKGEASGFEFSLANAAAKITRKEQGTSGHRAIRRVPLGWQHPKDEEGEFVPLFDSREVAGHYTIEELTELRGDGMGKDPGSWFMPTFAGVPDDEMGVCLYEITTEGTPITPVFPDTEDGHKDLVAYAAEYATTFGSNSIASAEYWEERFFSEGTELAA